MSLLISNRLEVLNLNWPSIKQLHYGGPHDSSCLEVGVTQFHSVKLCEKLSQLESIVSKKEKLEDKLMFYLITRLSHQFQFHWPNNNHLL